MKNGKTFKIEMMMKMNRTILKNLAMISFLMISFLGISQENEQLKKSPTMMSPELCIAHTAHGKDTDANTQYSMHSFRGRGAVSRSLGGTAVGDIWSPVG